MAAFFPELSVIVPMFNEEQTIVRTLRALRAGAPGAELIVVDGGSRDRSREIATGNCDRLIESARGRARQLNAGAAIARGSILAFVHADTVVPVDFAVQIKRALAQPTIGGGRFDVVLDNSALPYRLIGALISIRSRLSRTGTGDQAIFVRREIFRRLGGFPEIAICEDLEFTRRLKRAGKVACLRSRVITSARRWEQAGVLRTSLRMWTIRLLFLAGIRPEHLSRWYADVRRA